LKRIRSRLTYANVMSSVAVFLVVAGGSAFAANQLAKNSVGTKQIKKNAVTTAKLKARAVKSGKIAVAAVRGNQVADHALSSAQIAPGSIKPESLEVPLAILASFGGASAAVPSGEMVAYPLNNATWTQAPEQITVLFGGVRATVAAKPGEFCEAFVEVLQDGQQIGGGGVQTSSETPSTVEGSIGANPQVGFSTKTHTLTAKIGSNGQCTAGSRIDSTLFRILSFD
jgi:methionine-rich copper-binding protein CopC